MTYILAAYRFGKLPLAISDRDMLRDRFGIDVDFIYIKVNEYGYILIVECNYDTFLCLQEELHLR